MAELQATNHGNENPKKSLYEQAKDVLSAHAQDLINRLEAYDLPEEKMQQICDHAVHMKAKYPLMENARIVRKTVEYFKLKPPSESIHH